MIEVLWILLDELIQLVELSRFYEVSESEHSSEKVSVRICFCDRDHREEHTDKCTYHKIQHQSYRFRSCKQAECV